MEPKTLFSRQAAIIICAEMHVKLMSITPACAMQGGSIRHHHEQLVIKLHRLSRFWHVASHREDHGREIDGVWCTAKQTDMSCLSTWHEQSMRLELGKHVCMYGDFRGQWGVPRSKSKQHTTFKKWTC